MTLLSCRTLSCVSVAGSWSDLPGVRGSVRLFFAPGSRPAESSGFKLNEVIIQDGINNEETPF